MSQLLPKLWQIIHHSMSIIFWSYDQKQLSAAIFATILINGNSWNCWTCQRHLYWICNVHEQCQTCIKTQKSRYYDNYLWNYGHKMDFCSHIRQPFWKMVTPGTVKVVKTILNEFLMSIHGSFSEKREFCMFRKL